MAAGLNSEFGIRNAESVALHSPPPQVPARAARAPGAGLQSAIRNPQSAMPRGFSMLELLLAGVILGIGLIMIAGMFPVALDQHRQSAQSIIAMQHALQAKRLVETNLVPHVDPLRNLRSGAVNWNSNQGPDPRDADRNDFLDAAEKAPRGPLRWDPQPNWWYLLHFEMIESPSSGAPGSPVRPATINGQPVGIPYADRLNEGPLVPRAPWFRITDTITPTVRFLPNNTAPGNLGAAPFNGPLATPSYASFLFYRRAAASHMSTNLAYLIAVCRFAAGEEFVFQDTSPGYHIAPTPADPTGNPLSALPVPWRVAVVPSLARSGVMIESDGSTATRWDNSANDPRLSTLAPRGSRLLGQRTGTIYTVLRSPGVDPDDPSGGPAEHVIEVLPPMPEDTNGNGVLDPGEDLNNNGVLDALPEEVWVFPPPVAPGTDGRVFQTRSPFVTELRF